MGEWQAEKQKKLEEQMEQEEGEEKEEDEDKEGEEEEQEQHQEEKVVAEKKDKGPEKKVEVEAVKSEIEDAVEAIRKVKLQIEKDTLLKGRRHKLKEFDSKVGELSAEKSKLDVELK